MRVLWITLFTVLVDQVTKAVVLRSMYRGQSIPILGDWLKLTFTENPGMAFGITFGPKALVTIFSMLATALIIFYLFKVRRGYLPYRASLALILGGAVGNIIDRVFYGVILGYETFFVGRVVDFIHVNLWSGLVPDAVPFLGGMYISLFPIWNVADMAIVCGVVGILFFQRAYHRILLDEREQATAGLEEPARMPFSGPEDGVPAEVVAAAPASNDPAPGFEAAREENETSERTGSGEGSPPA
jgi:signal peptidase II